MLSHFGNESLHPIPHFSCLPMVTVAWGRRTKAMHISYSSTVLKPMMCPVELWRNSPERLSGDCVRSSGCHFLCHCFCWVVVVVVCLLFNMRKVSHFRLKTMLCAHWVFSICPLGSGCFAAPQVAVSASPFV